MSVELSVDTSVADASCRAVDHLGAPLVVLATDLDPLRVKASGVALSAVNACPCVVVVVVAGARAVVGGVVEAVGAFDGGLPLVIFATGFEMCVVYAEGVTGATLPFGADHLGSSTVTVCISPAPVPAGLDLRLVAVARDQPEPVPTFVPTERSTVADMSPGRWETELATDHLRTACGEVPRADRTPLIVVSHVDPPLSGPLTVHESDFTIARAAAINTAIRACRTVGPCVVGIADLRLLFVKAPGVAGSAVNARP